MPTLPSHDEIAPHPTNGGTGAALRRWVTDESTAGMLLLVAALVALVWANSPWRGAYAGLGEVVVGPASWHLDLTLAQWATDGLLAVFFLVVGLELKQELVAGSLRHPREAAVPVLAAVGGMAVPAAVYLSVLALEGDLSARHGWAVPTVTDIAFALAVLAVAGRGLPASIRTFLLTLAVVDDLLGILVIAAVYTDEVHPVPLLGALAAVALIVLLARVRRPPVVLCVLLALAAWVFMHASGVHATIAGVLVGFAVPVPPRHGEASSRAGRLEHAVRPWSAGLALPVFAFFAAGVTVIGMPGGVGEVLLQPVVPAVVAGLVVGKVVGVLGTTALVTRLTPLRLPPFIGMRDLLPVGLLAGTGFTVALLLAELAFDDPVHRSGAKAAILLGSLVAAAGAAAALRLDVRRARSADMNEDGVIDT